MELETRKASVGLGVNIAWSRADVYGPGVSAQHLAGHWPRHSHKIRNTRRLKPLHNRQQFYVSHDFF